VPLLEEGSGNETEETSLDLADGGSEAVAEWRDG
jgi:hypothetical protein